MPWLIPQRRVARSPLPRPGCVWGSRLGLNRCFVHCRLKKQFCCEKKAETRERVVTLVCSLYERKENTHEYICSQAGTARNEYCVGSWRLGGRPQLERRHRAPAGRRLQRHRTPVSDDRAGG